MTFGFTVKFLKTSLENPKTNKFEFIFDKTVTNVLILLITTKSCQWTYWTKSQIFDESCFHRTGARFFSLFCRRFHFAVSGGRDLRPGHGHRPLHGRSAGQDGRERRRRHDVKVAHLCNVGKGKFVMI